MTRVDLLSHFDRDLSQRSEHDRNVADQVILSVSGPDPDLWPDDAIDARQTRGVSHAGDILAKRKAPSNEGHSLEQVDDCERRGVLPGGVDMQKSSSRMDDPAAGSFYFSVI